MITYNHEKFIGEAIETIVNQQTNFDFELIIGDDFSTDSTLQICIEYQQKYPQIITLLSSTHNLGMMPNFIRTLQACKGDYLALWEGDDDWTDTHKRQKQVDLLALNLDYVACFHNTLELVEADLTKNFYYCSKEQKEILTLVELLPSNCMPTCSVVFRNNLFEGFPSWYGELGMGDWSLHILNAQYGKVKYIKEVMGVHRVHEGGVWSRRKISQNILDMLKAYDIFDTHLEFKYHKDIQNHKFNYLNQLHQEYILEKETTKSIGVLFKQINIWRGFVLQKEFYQKLIKSILN